MCPGLTRLLTDSGPVLLGAFPTPTSINKTSCLQQRDLVSGMAVSIYFTRLTHSQVPNVAPSMHAQQYNLYGKWNQIMVSLNVMAALKGNVTVNSCQIMDHAEVSQLH